VTGGIVFCTMKDRNPASDSLETHIERIEKDGFTIVENALELDFVDELAAALLELERKLDIIPAGNEFEGAHTARIYNLLTHGELFERIPVHASVLPIVERVLDPGCLVSSLSSISIDPGESAQPIHADDLFPVSRIGSN
jgi:hypothetical protein